MRIPGYSPVARTLSLAVLAALIPLHAGAQARSGPAGGVLEAGIWLDRGPNAVLAPGDRTRIYYRASRHAHVAVLHVDTNGTLRLRAPAGPGDPRRIRGGQDYRLLLAGEPAWEVEEEPGVGYFFILASAAPLDLERLEALIGAGRDDLSRTGVPIRRDPHGVLEELSAALAVTARGDDTALAVAMYRVGQPYAYPRFLCYACHAAAPVEQWNPYHRTCTDFRVVIQGVAGTGVTSGPRALGTRFVMKERGPGEPGTPLVRGGAGLGPDPADAGVSLRSPGRDLREPHRGEALPQGVRRPVLERRTPDPGVPSRPADPPPH